MVSIGNKLCLGTIRSKYKKGQNDLSPEVNLLGWMETRNTDERIASTCNTYYFATIWTENTNKFSTKVQIDFSLDILTMVESKVKIAG